MKRAIKTSIIHALDFVGQWYDAPGIPVLCYHSIDDSGSLLSTSPGLFALQMSYLRDHGYRTIALGEVCRLITEAQALPPRHVALTFDDAFSSFLSHGAPILKRHGFFATIFVPTGHVGARANWLTTPDVPTLDILSWNELRGLGDEGFEIGSHSVSHPNLCRLSSPQALREIVDSKQVIEQNLGCPVTLIDGRARPGDNLMAIKRINVTGVSRVGDRAKLAFFRASVKGTASWYMQLKEAFPGYVDHPTPWKHR